MNDSAINWRVVTYTVGGCWLIFGCMLLLLGQNFALFLNPFPIVVKGIFGGLVFGYVGSTSGMNIEAVLIYWTLVGLWLSLLFHLFRFSRAVIITVTGLLHVVLSVCSLFPMMLMNGR